MKPVQYITAAEDNKVGKKRDKNKQYSHARKENRLFSLLSDVGHFWPACGYKTNPTLSNTIISVSTNAEAEMSLKSILISNKILHSWQNIWKKQINNAVGGHHSAVTPFEGIPTVQWSQWEQFSRSALHKNVEHVNSVRCHLSVSQLWPLTLWDQAHSQLQSVIRALIFLWRRTVITECGTTVRSPLHLLLTALWQLNTQVREFPLGCFLIGWFSAV